MVLNSSTDPHTQDMTLCYSQIAAANHENRLQGLILTHTLVTDACTHTYTHFFDFVPLPDCSFMVLKSSRSESI